MDAAPSTPHERLNEMLQTEFIKSDDIILKELLSSEILGKADIIPAVPNPAKFLESAYWVYTGDKAEKFRDKLPITVLKLVPDAPEQFLSEIEQTQPSADELEFACALCIYKFKENKDQNLAGRVSSFIKKSSREISAGTALKLRDKIMQALEIPSEDADELMEQIISEENISISEKISAAFPLLSLVSEETEKKVLLDFIAATENYRPFETEQLLDEAVQLFKTGRLPLSSKEILTVFMKKNAMRLTMPTLNTKMNLDEETIEKSLFLKKYDSEKWSWENCGQTLFCALAILSRADSDYETREAALGLIMYVLRHRSRNTGGFLLNDSIIFRIIKELTVLSEERSDDKNLDSAVEETKTFVRALADRKDFAQSMINSDLADVIVLWSESECGENTVKICERAVFALINDNIESPFLERMSDSRILNDNIKKMIKMKLSRQHR